MTARSLIAQEPWAILPETLEAIAAGANLATDSRSRSTGRAPKASGGVAVIPLYGILTARETTFTRIYGGTPLDWFAQALRLADASGQVGSIVLDVDSPGGSTSMLTETAALIRAARTPTVAVANTLAASGSYWLAAQADEVVASPSSLLGSIGVYGVHEDISGLEQKLGVKTTLISSGRYKVEGNPHEPLGAEARAAMQSLVADVYGDFVRDVALGRGVSTATVRDGYGEGRVVTAARAVKLGMADRVGTLDATIARLERGQLPAGRRGAGASRALGHPTSTAERVRRQLELLEERHAE